MSRGSCVSTIVRTMVRWLSVGDLVLPPIFFYSEFSILALRLFTALVDSYASLRAKNASSHLASALRSALTGAAAHSRADCGAAPAGVASIAFRLPPS